MDLAQEFSDGYRDGFKVDTPEPSGNRSHSYRHGFEVGRSDRSHRPAFGNAMIARELASAAAEKDNGF